MSQAYAIPSVDPSVMYPTIPGTLRGKTARTWTGNICEDHTDLLPLADHLEVMTAFSGQPQASVTVPMHKVVDLLAVRFKKRLAEWKSAKEALSSISAIALLPAYQQIIGMGENAVPLILRQLRVEGDQPDMWFWALKAITEADPVSEDDRGDFIAMAASWLEWGRKNGVS